MNKDDKKLKSSSSKRLIPLHPFLTEKLHLPEYVDHLRRKGEQRLFPELKYSRDGYGTSASKWFGRYKKTCGINDNDKAFHSFRHTFINDLKKKSVAEIMLKELAGHKEESETFGRYAKKYEVPQLFTEAISKIDHDLKIKALIF